MEDGDRKEMLDLAYEIGDYCNGSSHGTPNQRRAALERGLNLGLENFFEQALEICIKEYE